ncbi:hypothetical protein KFK09_009249 [Dendrobium nobile]|uniref:Uncharacterized protein n=1 Tax=Dendrobium nobile TaxID=94219 RepID=A0A8T3BRU0_DENNO|nr:hypothetical protein KFK09_009249 [Dendrobium nobile]
MVLFTFCTFIYKFVNILGEVITGSWDKTFEFWDPRGVNRPKYTLVGTYPQPERFVLFL